MADKKPALSPKTWKEFQDSGLLWWINRTLHLFGWAIVLEVDDETGEVKRAYPARSRFRGFGPVDDDEGFKKLTAHLRDNVDTLVEDCAWGDDDSPVEPAQKPAP